MSPRKGDFWRRLRAELRAKPRQAFALVLLVPVLVAVWLPLLLAGETAPAPATAIPDALMQGSAATRRADLGAVARLRPRLASWIAPTHPLAPARDPFASTAASAPAELADAPERATPTTAADDAANEAASASRLRLGATFLSPGRRAAARIDDRLLTQGEPFGVFVLEEVGPRWVSLRGRHGRYRLEMVRGGGG
ncbi:MAG: hypothetical protein IPN34_13525 [Planctomycetes bacterium]|nr:hypothetical protein [Planctomycetota bacterium]